MSQPEDFITDADDAYEWKDTAITNGQDLTAIRRDLREYVKWLADPVRGTVIFRSEVIERLKQILAP